MIGFMLVITVPGKTELRHLYTAEFGRKGGPTLEQMRAGVGGHFELVPYWSVIKWEDKWYQCRVFCDGDGKQKGYQLNQTATMLWDELLKKRGLSRHGDFLVGDIAVMCGDSEFLRLL